MRGLRVRFTVEAGLAPEAQNFLELIPGVAAKKAPYLGKPGPGEVEPPPFRAGYQADCPIDAVSIVQSYLHMLAKTDVTLETYSRPGSLPATATRISLEELPSILPEVVKSAYSFQKDGFTFFQARDGGMAHWDCGTGKTRLGVFFADADQGDSGIVQGIQRARRRIVIITLSSTRFQFASALQDMVKPGCLPWVILEDEIPVRLRPARAPQRKAYRIPVAEGGPWVPAAYRALCASTKSLIVAYQVGEILTPKKDLPEVGDVLPLPVSQRIRQACTLYPVLSDETVALLDRIEEAGDQGVPAEEVSADLRKKLAAVGLLETRREASDAQFEVYEVRSDAVLYRPTGREGLAFTVKEKGDLINRRMAMETQPAEKAVCQVLLTSEGLTTPEQVAETTGVPLEEVLRIRAKRIGEQWVDRCRARCDLGPEVEVCILSWQMLPSRREFLVNWRPTTLILDESQWAKSKDVWTVEDNGFGDPKFIYGPSIAAGAHFISDRIPRVLEMTASPAPNRAKDWWSQMQILTRGCGRYRVFTDRYCDGKQLQINDHLTIYSDDGVSRPEELRARLHFWVHRVTEDMANRELPPIRREFIRIPKGELTDVRVSNAEWRAAKARGAQGLQEMHVLIAASMKRPFLRKRAVEHLGSGMKAVLFSGRILDCDLTYQEIRDAVPKDVEIWCIHGSNLPSGDHSKYIYSVAQKYLHHPGPCLLIGTEDIWGTGVDGLQRTHRAMRARLPINPVQWEQPEGRFNRPVKPPLTQISTVIEYYHAEGTIDDRIFELFGDKMLTVSETYGGTMQTRMRDVLSQFRGAGGTEEEALQQMASQLVSGLPEGMFDSFDEDE